MMGTRARSQTGMTSCLIALMRWRPSASPGPNVAMFRRIS